MTGYLEILAATAEQNKKKPRNIVRYFLFYLIWWFDAKPMLRPFFPER